MMETKHLTSANGELLHRACPIENTIKKIIKLKQMTTVGHFDQPFFLGELGVIRRQYDKMKSLLPRAEVFYAMKACNQPEVLRLLADMGASFDCASQGEIEMILRLGVDPSRIIFANTVKFISSLQFASENNVSLMTFDNEEELEKIKKYYPEARLILRIRCEGSHKSLQNLGMKFGCSLEKVPRLLTNAKMLELSVDGISFMVGTGATEARVYTAAIKDAHIAFHMGKIAGFNFRILDIGGGFIDTSFEKVVEDINHCLDDYFPPDSGVRIMAEPGRFLVNSAFTWVVQIIGKRSNETMEEGIVFENGHEQTAAPRFLYYVNDGIHGSRPFFIANVPPIQPLVQKLFLSNGRSTTMHYPSVIFGPCCNGVDTLYGHVSLPELYIGDWLYLKNAGAYSMVLASDFNMMPRAQCYFVSEEMEIDTCSQG